MTSMESIQDYLNSICWGNLREITGPATRVPVSFIKLLNAQSQEDADLHYWSLENHVVVQGQLFDSALALLPALFMSLQVVPAERRFVRFSVYDLIVQILSGVTDAEEAARGITGLEMSCLQVANSFLAQIRRIPQSFPAERENIEEIVQLISTRD